jgi:hypothetical protein
MKMGQGTNKAIMTSGWDDAIKGNKIKEEDIILFHFEPAADGMYLMMVILPEPYA